MVNKIQSVPEVVQSIPSASRIALGGFAIARSVIAVVHELIRQQKSDLLVGAGLVKHLIMGGGSLT
jgi:acyl CoA:acetate/3-ketoacid CoA transferase alpha subunit